MTISKMYKISAGEKIFRVTTQLNEKEFLKTLDAVYGCNNYTILEEEVMF